MSRDNQFMPLYVGDYLADTGHLTAEEHGAYLLLLMAAWTRDGALPADEERLRALARMDRRQWARSRVAVLAFFVAQDGVLRNARLDRERFRVSKLISKRQSAGRAGAANRWRKSNKIKGDAMAKPSVCQWQNDGSDDDNHGSSERSNASSLTVGDANLREKSNKIKGDPMAKPSVCQWQNDAIHNHNHNIEESYDSSLNDHSTAKSNELAEEFETFWRAYPRRIGRGQARLAFERARRKVSLAHMLAALGRMRWPADKQLIPHPSTWLNGERWTDDPAAIANGDARPHGPRHETAANRMRALMDTMQPKPPAAVDVEEWEESR